MSELKQIEEFSIGLQKRQNKKAISYVIYTNDSYGLSFVDDDLLKVIPSKLENFYTLFNGLKIETPRHFEFLKPINLVLHNERYLIFAIFDATEMVCFDLGSKNSAGEFDIINYNNKFLITKTWGSFLTNKIWAWLDRGRRVWQEEIYK